MHRLSRRHWAALGVGAALSVALLSALSIWNDSRARREARTQAETLLAPFVPDGAIELEEYAALEQINVAAMPVRRALAALVQEREYQPLVADSAELFGSALVGFDADGQTSRQLMEQAICQPLENAAPTAANAVPLFLVHWLNPLQLDSRYCAAVLTEHVINADPGSFAQGAQLLALVLGALPAEQAAPHVGALVSQAAVASPAGMGVLFSALRHVDSQAFPAEFAQAVATVSQRIEAAERPADLASLFGAMDSLKYSVSTEQLVPVLDAAIGKMLALDQPVVTRELYFTLTDLKISHPDASFGAHADYLMRGINVYSDALEIYDYSNVLRLDLQYPAGQESALAAALLAAARSVPPDDYISSIWPYCERFLQVSSMLDYAQFLDGARLMVEQLHRPEFIFQRPCLLDSDLVARIEPGDRDEFVAIVIDSLTQPGGAMPARRVAESVEFLGLLGRDLSSEQIASVGTAILGHAPNVLQTVAGTDLNLPPELYAELFVRAVNDPEVTANRRGLGALSPIVGKLPEAQRARIVDSARAALFAEQAEPAQLAEQAEFLLALGQELSAGDRERAATALVTAMADPRSIPEFYRLTTSLNRFRPRGNSHRAAAQAAALQHLGNTSERGALAGLLQSASSLAVAGSGSAAGATLRAAAVRFLAQIVPDDAQIGAVRSVLERPSTLAKRTGTERRIRATSRVTLEPADVEQLAARFIAALANERLTQPIGNYALSLETLAVHARPGELSALLAALRQRLDASTDPASHELLVESWIAVETSTNSELTPEQRIPLYLDVLRLPLTSAASRVLLVNQAGMIAEREFGGDVWTLLEWVNAATPPGA